MSASSDFDCDCAFWIRPGHTFSDADMFWFGVSPYHDGGCWDISEEMAGMVIVGRKDPNLITGCVTFDLFHSGALSDLLFNDMDEFPYEVRRFIPMLRKLSCATYHSGSWKVYPYPHVLGRSGAPGSFAEPHPPRLMRRESTHFTASVGQVTRHAAEFLQNQTVIILKGQEKVTRAVPIAKLQASVKEHLIPESWPCTRTPHSSEGSQHEEVIPPTKGGHPPSLELDAEKDLRLERERMESLNPNYDSEQERIDREEREWYLDDFHGVDPLDDDYPPYHSDYDDSEDELPQSDN